MGALRFLDEGEPAPAEFAVAGLIPKRGLTLVVGAEACGKSMIAAELAAATTTGGAWAGRSITTGSVLYIAPERGAVTERRLFGMLGKDRRIGLATGPLDLRDPASIDVLREYARRVVQHSGAPLGLIVIDTLAAATPGMKENETTDTARIGTALGHLSEALGAPIVVLHHVRKSDGTARGSGALTAAADAVLLVKADRSGRRVIYAEKLSDGAPAAPVKFTIEEVEGSPRVNWVSSANAGSEPVTSTLPRSARAALDVLKTIAPDSPIDIDDWREAVYALWPDKKPGTARQAFNEARTRLEASGLITIDGKNVAVRNRQEPSETNAQASGSGVRKHPSMGVLTLADASDADEVEDDGWFNAWAGADDEPPGWEGVAA